MKETNQKVIDKLKEELAQEINSIEEINNPVITEEDKNNNPDPIITEEPIEEIKEEEPTTQPNNIEEMTDPNIGLNPDTVIDLPTVEPTPTIERPKNTVRYIDGGFTF